MATKLKIEKRGDEILSEMLTDGRKVMAIAQ
jgi:Flp pilus assembly protein CpaB